MYPWCHETSHGRSGEIPSDRQSSFHLLASISSTSARLIQLPSRCWSSGSSFQFLFTSDQHTRPVHDNLAHLDEYCTLWTTRLTACIVYLGREHSLSIDVVAAYRPVSMAVPPGRREVCLCAGWRGQFSARILSRSIFIPGCSCDWPDNYFILIKIQM